LKSFTNCVNLTSSGTRSSRARLIWPFIHTYPPYSHPKILTNSPKPRPDLVPNGRRCRREVSPRSSPTSGDRLTTATIDLKRCLLARVSTRLLLLVAQACRDRAGLFRQFSTAFDPARAIKRLSE
jgi:hypothetical protein